MKRLVGILMAITFFTLASSFCAIAGETSAILASLDSDGVATQKLNDETLGEVKGTGWMPAGSALPTYTQGLRYFQMRKNSFGSAADAASYYVQNVWTYPGQYRTLTYSDGSVDRMHGDIYYPVTEPSTTNNVYERHLVAVVLAKQPSGESVYIPRYTNGVWVESKTWNRPLNFQW